MKYIAIVAASLLLGACLLAGCQSAPKAVQTPETAAVVTTEQATPEAAAGQATAETAAPTPSPAPQAERIALETTEGILTTGSGWTLRATVLPEDAADKTILWTSDNEAVATVDENGVVTAHSAGTAVLTGHCGDATAQYTMYVKDPACSYCGGSGHAASACPVQAADQQAAVQATQQAQAAAEQQAVAEAAAQQSAAAPSEDSDPLVTNRWGITLRQSEWDEIYRTSGATPDDCTSYSSGIDWTQDASCADGNMMARDENGNILRDENGNPHMNLDSEGRPIPPEGAEDYCFD